jgi:hypothetical protein
MFHAYSVLLSLTTSPPFSFKVFPYYHPITDHGGGQHPCGHYHWHRATICGYDVYAVVFLLRQHSHSCVDICKGTSPALILRKAVESFCVSKL